MSLPNQRRRQLSRRLVLSFGKGNVVLRDLRIVATYFVPTCDSGQPTTLLSSLAEQL